MRLTVDNINSSSAMVDDLASSEALAPAEVEHGDAGAVA